MGTCQRALLVRAVRAPQCFRLVGIAVALGFSAHLVCLAASSAIWSWLVWVALTPFLLVLRRVGPRGGLAVGLWWGMCMGVCRLALAGLPVTAVDIAMPGLGFGLFAAAVCLLSRRIGFSPVIVALLWVGTELGLDVLGWHDGLLVASLASGPLLTWIGAVLGTALITFLIVWTNAQVVELLESVVELVRTVRAQQLLVHLVAACTWCRRIYGIPQTLLWMHEGGARAPPRVVC